MSGFKVLGSPLIAMRSSPPFCIVRLHAEENKTEISNRAKQADARAFTWPDDPMPDLFKMSTPHPRRHTETSSLRPSMKSGAPKARDCAQAPCNFRARGVDCPTKEAVRLLQAQAFPN